ncbi:MAG: MBOAT family protein [Bacteroidales bacterium]|nr:MBOAT family protein [Bacteroidales bacterium]
MITSLTFVFLFLPISILGYFLVSLTKNQVVTKIYLLLLTLFFCYWVQPETMFFFLFYSSVVYLVGNLIYENKLRIASDTKKRLTWLIVSSLVAICTIFYYKLSSVIDTSVFNSFYGETTKIIIPIGLSFLVFTSISYITDIYRGDAKAGNYLDTVLYLLFFPKLLSGPIVLWKDYQKDSFFVNNSANNIWHGIERICIGYAKKVIIADTLGAKIAEMHNVMHIGNPKLFSSDVLEQLPQTDIPMYWIAALLYMFQIYFDFSGYSDIAIGLCKVFGVNIKENFNYPYMSKSVGEFWRRWHISLGSWFREYVYIPMGGSRNGNVYFNLFVVFAFTGIWHGIGWTFVIWGLVNGIAVIVERFFKNNNLSKYIPDFLGHIYIPIFLYFSWLLFSCYDFTQFVDYLKNMVRPIYDGELNFSWEYYFDNKIKITLLIAILGSIVGYIPFVKTKIEQFLQYNVCKITKAVVCLLLFVVSILFIINSTYSPFIYFQF